MPDPADLTLVCRVHERAADSDRAFLLRLRDDAGGPVAALHAVPGRPLPVPDDAPADARHLGPEVARLSEATAADLLRALRDAGDAIRLR